MRSIRALASAPEVKSGLVKLDRVLSDVDKLVRHVDSKIDPLSARVDQAAVETRTTMTQTQAALARLTPAATATLADYQALAQDTRMLVAHTMRRSRSSRRRSSKPWPMRAVSGAMTPR